MKSDGVREYSIADFAEQLKDERLVAHGLEGFQYHYMEIYLVCRLASSQCSEEAKGLLRAILNIWIRSEIEKQPETDRKRQRNLLINRVKLADWQWIKKLENITRHYEKYPNRERHNAIISFTGNNYYFDSPPDFRPHI